MAQINVSKRAFRVTRPARNFKFSRVTTNIVLVLGFLATAVAVPAWAEPVIVATSNEDGRFEVFSVQSPGPVRHRWRIPGPIDWSGWNNNVEGQFSDVVVVEAPTRRLFLFGLDAGVLVIRSQRVPNGAWGAETVRTGHDLKTISAAINADGRLEAFAVGGNGALYSINATDGSATGWSEWRNLGESGLKAVTVERDGNGRLTVVAIGSGGALKTIAQRSANGGWGSWSSLGGNDLTEAKLVRSINGSLTLLAIGSDGRLFSRTKGSTDAWSEWTLVSGQPLVHLSSLHAAANANGLIELVAISTSTSALHMAQRPDLSFPSEWTVLPTPAGITTYGDISIATNRAGSALIAAKDTNGQACVINRSSNTDMKDWSTAFWRCFESQVASAIEISGMSADTVGRPVHVTQGLTGYVLTAGKATLLRAFVAPNTLTEVESADIEVNIFSGTSVSTKKVVVTKPGLLLESSAPLGPSIGVIVPGNVIGAGPLADMNVRFRDTSGSVLQESRVGRFVFQRTKDLNILVVPAELGYAPGMPRFDAAWNADIARAMRRLAAMLPVRDGATAALNNSSPSGLRYRIGTPCRENFHPLFSPQDFSGDRTGAVYYACVYDQTRAENARRADGDKIDLTIEYRPGLFAPAFMPPGPTDPSPGGNSGRPPAPYADLPRAACVSGRWGGRWMTAPCYAQEFGHNLGLEPPGSPHYQDPADPGHSKDPAIVDAFAFDFVNRRPYPSGAGDTMNNASNGSWRGDEAALFNAYDFNFMRTRIAAKTASTGP